MCRATAEAYETLKPGERPFVLTRSGYAGIQRHAAVWTGDNHSWWEHLAAGLPMLLNLSLSGVPFCGGDAGGFQGEASAELFARWMQFAAFTPFFRAHSAIDTKAHEPWAFGSETERVAREAIRLRYRLMPYLYGEMHRASLNGTPVIRPMVFEFPGDPEVRTMCDQFMFGPSLLVAPVTQPGKKERLVYLPAGIWYDWHTDERIDGGRTIIAKAPLDVIPLYARAGAVIPTVEPAAHTGALDFTRVTVRAYSGADGSFELYEDDGLTTGYANGAYNLSRISIEKATSRVLVEPIHRGWAGGCPSPEIKII
jgi:alpha-glucosidase